MIKSIVHCPLLMLLLDVSLSLSLSLSQPRIIVTTEKPTYLPLSSFPPTIHLSTTPNHLLSQPYTTTPLFHQQVFYILLVNCTSKCQRDDVSRTDAVKQIKEAIHSISGVVPNDVKVEVGEDNLVVIRCSMQYKRADEKLEVERWLNNEPVLLNISSLMTNKSATSHVGSSYSRSAPNACHDKCKQNECDHKEFSSERCFCSLYYAEDCQTWNKNLLWLLVIPAVWLLVLLILVIYYCSLKRDGNINPGSKKDQYMNTYDEVKIQNSAKKTAQQNENMAVEEKEESRIKGNDDEYFNVTNNPTFVGNHF